MASHVLPQRMLGKAPDLNRINDSSENVVTEANKLQMVAGGIFL